MTLYWFSDEEGGFWMVVAARTDDSAWQQLATAMKQELTQAKEEYKLNAKTEVSDKEGEVATIFPREVNFYIKAEPGGEVSMLTNH
jgi:hypothetical protein